MTVFSFLNFKTAKLFILQSLILLSFVSSAQDSTETKSLFRKGEGKLNSLSLAGGPNIYMAQTDGYFQLYLGVELYALINKKYALGLYASSLSPDFKIYTKTSSVNDSIRKLSFAHYGVMMGYILLSKKMINVGIFNKLGVGDVAWNFYSSTGATKKDVFADHVFVVMPELQAQFNITQWLRIAAGMGFIYAGGLNEINIYFNNSSPFSSPTFCAKLLVGKF